MKEISSQELASVHTLYIHIIYTLSFIYMRIQSFASLQGIWQQPGISGKERLFPIENTYDN